MANDEAVTRLDLGKAMTELGLSTSALARMTGRSRISVWRWKQEGRCPVYVQTILEQQRKIRALASLLAA